MKEADRLNEFFIGCKSANIIKRISMNKIRLREQYIFCNIPLLAHYGKNRLTECVIVNDQEDLDQVIY